MKISNHITPELLTYKHTYPYDKLTARFGPRFEHPTLNRAGDTFQAGKVDVLRSYRGEDVFNYSSRGKTFIIPNATSIRPVTWPFADGPLKDPSKDVISEYDAIRDFGNPGSRIIAQGLIDKDLIITTARRYRFKGENDPVTGELICTSNDWSKCEVPRKDQRTLPARTFVAYSIPGITDADGQPEKRTLLVYTGDSKGLQNEDGVILLYGFLPSADHPLTILAGL